MAYYEYSNAKLDSFFCLTDSYQLDRHRFTKKERLSMILWNRSEENISFEVDGASLSLKPHQICTLTFYHHYHFDTESSALTAFLFNRAFYCMLDHDDEVSCYGILFFGTQDVPIISLDKTEQYKFDILYKVFVDEMQTRDNIQGEMLQMLLKRLVIKSTRLAKTQCSLKSLSNPQVEIIRKFNYLVDLNFRQKKTVADYADLLHKSPKTLSNLFSLYNTKSPLQIIHERIVLEAKRLLKFSDLNNKAIAYELGFESPSQFSRLFKNVTGLSPSAFKKVQ